MATQTFANHVHQPRLTAVGYLFVFVALVFLTLRWLEIGGRLTFAVGLLALVGAVITLLLISRSYTTRLQDRIIRTEMRLRCAPLLTPDQQRMFAQLGMKQIAALRFASDPELPGLVERAARESLQPVDIKRAIKTWTPDLDRT
jgi:hypothetical protein